MLSYGNEIKTLKCTTTFIAHKQVLDTCMSLIIYIIMDFSNSKLTITFKSSVKICLMINNSQA